MLLPSRQPHKGTFQEWSRQEEHCEWINGVIYHKAAPPSTYHQYASTQLLLKLNAFFKGKGCVVFPAPTDVFFSQDYNYDEPDHVVIPDLSVICNKSQITKERIHGAPTLIVEVLSPSTAFKDYNYKKDLYQRFGVQEYWIVDAQNKSVTIVSLQEDGTYGYFYRHFSEHDTLISDTYPELHIDLSDDIFLSLP